MMQLLSALLTLTLLLTVNLSYAANQIEYPSFNFSDWPVDIITKLQNKFPELKNKKFTELELNTLLKKLHQEMRFDQLKIVQKDNQLFLVATISSKIEEISFSGLRDLDPDEAIEILALPLTEAQNESKLSSALDRLQTYYRNSGYRKAVVSSSIDNKSSTSRVLNINVNVGKKTQVSKIEIIGLDTAESTFIEKQFNWNGLGQVLSDQTLKTINSSLKKSLNDLGYYMVIPPSPQIIFTADETKARLIFKITPSAKFKIELTGKFYENKSLLENEVLKLNEYTATESQFATDLAEKLRQYYLAKGFLHAEVLFSERKENETTLISLNINEGPFVKISQISVWGNISRPENYYIKKFYSLASTNIQNKILIREEIEQAVNNLIISIQNEGFVSAKLARLQIGTDKDKTNKGVVGLQIDEGPQALIHRINISGNRFFSVEKILQVLNLQEGQKLNLTELEIAINNLKMFYASNGFIESKITTEGPKLIQYSDNLTEADIFIDLFEGPQIRVGSILIEGNTKTHSKLILSELDFGVGSLLTPENLEESIARLQRTGHFSTIDIYTLEANSPTQERTVVVRVAERKPGVFTSGVGLTNENNLTYQGYMGVAYRNIGGWGRGASIRLEGQYNPDFIRFFESKVTVGYLEPYLFDTRIRFRLNYTSSQNVTDINIRKVTVTNQTVWSLEQDFTSHLTGIYEILNVSNFVDRGIKREDEIKYGYEREDMVISSTGPTIDIDYRDNILNPTKGHWTRFTLEYAGDALGNHNVDDFIRATGQSTLYLTLSEELGFVWANSYRGGYVKNINETVHGVPFDKKGFILGGRSTVRGFESSEFFPSTDELGVNYKLNDHSVYQLIKSELRFPLLGSHELTGAVFYDGGEVLVDNINLPDRYRDSFGIGLRYNTPVGPLNLEYARKLDRKSYESEGAFHLSVGVF